jgi:hypothetical protein
MKMNNDLCYCSKCCGEDDISNQSSQEKQIIALSYTIEARVLANDMLEAKRIIDDALEDISYIQTYEMEDFYDWEGI